MEIQISGQYGDPQADDMFWPLQKRLNECFKKHIVNDYFESVTKLSIVFRASGKIWNFESQGAECLRYLKKANTLTIDYVFTESQCLDADITEFKKIIAQGTTECLELMLQKAVKLGELLDKETLLSDIGRSIGEFLQ